MATESAQDTTTGFDFGAVLREIAKPRMTGSTGATETGAAIRAHFESYGYEVQDRPFLFNPWPGRFGITAVGAVYLVATFIAASLIYNGRPAVALSILLTLLVVALLIGFLAGPLIDKLPFGRVQGSNMLCLPKGTRPRYIIMAHRDSKSQPLPLSFRGPAIVLGILAWIAMVIVAVFHIASPLPQTIILVVGVAAFLAGVILIFCWVENKSPGALDNASGVVAALGVASRERASGDVAFLITDAEELGLAGARAAARSLPPVFGVINIDGLDDDGSFYVFERFGMFRKQGLAPHLAAALLQEASSRNEPADRRDLPFGIPVDHIPIVKAGIPALTLTRGTLKSLRRVHRPSDDVEHLRGDGIEKAIDLLSGALKRLREQG